MRVFHLEIKRSFLYILGTYFSQIVVFITFFILWRNLKSAQMGVIAVIEMISSVWNIFLNLSLEQSINRFFYELDTGLREKFLGTIWLSSLLANVLLGGLAASVTLFILPYLQQDYFSISLYGLASVGIVLGSMQIVPFSTLRITQYAKVFVLYRIGIDLIQLIGVFIFVCVLHRGIWGYYLASSISGVLILIGAIAIMTKIASLQFDFSLLKKSFSFSIPILPSNFLNVFGSIVDRFLLIQFAPLHVLGVYSVALKLSGVVSTMQSAVKLTFGPFFMKHIQQPHGQELIAKSVGYFLFPIFLAAIGILTCSQYIVLFVGKIEYFEALKYIPILTVTVLISQMNVFFATGTAMSKKTGFLTIPALLQLFLANVLGLFLGARYFIWGILFAKLCATVLFFLVSSFIAHKAYKIKNNWEALGLYSGLLAICIALMDFFKFETLLAQALFSLLMVLGFAGLSYIGIVWISKKYQTA